MIDLAELLRKHMQSRVFSQLQHDTALSLTFLKELGRLFQKKL